jgi:hypothetical protein
MRFVLAGDSRHRAPRFQAVPVLHTPLPDECLGFAEADAFMHHMSIDGPKRPSVDALFLGWASR